MIVFSFRELTRYQVINKLIQLFFIFLCFSSSGNCFIFNTFISLLVAKRVTFHFLVILIRHKMPRLYNFHGHHYMKYSLIRNVMWVYFINFKFFPFLKIWSGKFFFYSFLKVFFFYFKMRLEQLFIYLTHILFNY